MLTNERVCSEMRLVDGTLWPIPITLDVSELFARQLKPSTRVALRDEEGTMLAALTVEEVWRPDRAAEAAMVFGTGDESHPGVGVFDAVQRNLLRGGDRRRDSASNTLRF